MEVTTEMEKQHLTQADRIDSLLDTTTGEITTHKLKVIAYIMRVNS
jgi:hypothetical protein